MHDTGSRTWPFSLTVLFVVFLSLQVQIVGTGSDARVDKSLKSSSAFFARLQDESAAAVAKAKVSNAKKREAIAKNSSHFML